MVWKRLRSFPNHFFTERVPKIKCIVTTKNAVYGHDLSREKANQQSPQALLVCKYKNKYFRWKWPERSGGHSKSSAQLQSTRIKGLLLPTFAQQPSAPRCGASVPRPAGWSDVPRSAGGTYLYIGCGTGKENGENVIYGEGQALAELRSY